MWNPQFITDHQCIILNRINDQCYHRVKNGRNSYDFWEKEQFFIAILPNQNNKTITAFALCRVEADCIVRWDCDK